MIVFFLPNGIGDTLMAIPAIRRLVDVRGVDGVVMVVSNGLHTRLVHRFVDRGLRTLERYDGRPFPHLRLWTRLLALRFEVICAPLLSSKPLHTAFFASLLRQVQVPSTYVAAPWLRLRRSRLALEQFDGHQVNFFVQFLAELEPLIDSSRVEFSELASKSNHGTPNVPRVTSVARIALGISCGELERHKIPGPPFFARLLNLLVRQRPIELLVIGGPADQPMIDELRSLLAPHILVEMVINLPIEALIGRLRECELGISGTTGQGHMMAAAGLPMLVLAGVTNPYESGPYVQRAVVLRHRYACGPCYQEAFRLGCGSVSCMETLDAEEGAQLVEQLLDNPEYGRDWLFKSHKQAPVPITTIKNLHARSQTEWIFSKDSQ
jgi:hypothetical protein